MILSMAHAEIAEAERENVYGEWSDLVVGEKPDGLVTAYLVTDGGYVRVVALWQTIEAHEKALEDDKTHPAFRVFEVAGLDPHHTLMKVEGSLG